MAILIFFFFSSHCPLGFGLGISYMLIEWIDFNFVFDCTGDGRFLGGNGYDDESNQAQRKPLVTSPFSCFAPNMRIALCFSLVSYNLRPL